MLCLAEPSSEAQVLSARKIAREYNAGLDAAIAAVDQHNQKTVDEMTAVGVHAKHIKKALLPRPLKCPEELNARFCRRWMKTFQWKRAARNTAGAYLEHWFQSLSVMFVVSFSLCGCRKICFWCLCS